VAKRCGRRVLSARAAIGQQLTSSPSPSLIVPLEHLIKPGAHISACDCIEQLQSRRATPLSNLSNHLRAVAAAARFGRGGGKGTRSREATTLCVGGSVDPALDPWTIAAGMGGANRAIGGVSGGHCDLRGSSSILIGRDSGEALRLPVISTVGSRAASRAASSCL
jgi:hypothetical protein